MTDDACRESVTLRRSQLHAAHNHSDCGHFVDLGLLTDEGCKWLDEIGEKVQDPEFWDALIGWPF